MMKKSKKRFLELRIRKIRIMKIVEDRISQIIFVWECFFYLLCRNWFYFLSFREFAWFRLMGEQHLVSSKLQSHDQNIWILSYTPMEHQTLSQNQTLKYFWNSFRPDQSYNCRTSLQYLCKRLFGYQLFGIDAGRIQHQLFYWSI